MAQRTKAVIVKATKSKQSQLLGRVQEVIDNRVKPYIQMHAGDIELIELTPENVLKVRLHGACVGCNASSLTLYTGVQQILFDEFPEEDIQLLQIED